MTLKVRPLTTEEDSTIERLIPTRAMPTWNGTRAKIIWYVEQGQKVPEIAKRLELTGKNRSPVAQTLQWVGHERPRGVSAFWSASNLSATAN
jgi:hypothetical protein